MGMTKRVAEEISQSSQNLKEMYRDAYEMGVKSGRQDIRIELLKAGQDKSAEIQAFILDFNQANQ